MPEPGFLENLRRSRLLSEKQLAAIAPLADDNDIRALARVLVQKGWMTPWQVRQVAAGKPEYLRLGDYILQDKVGEGAMGEVFRASHFKHGTVALKVMRREKLSNPASVKRFFKEIELAARLSHPHIVRAIDSGAAGDSYYLAMEFVEGTDLSRLVKEHGPLGIAQACHYIRQAALALHHAHECGIVHRDMKPGNLMIDAAGQIKLLDLGLARLETFEGNTALTRLGQMIGTPDYLAPEQALDARSADPRADLYSLGCTLFYLITGKPPFTATSLADLLLKHQSELARPLKSFRPDAPDWLVQLCGWMMNKRREDRPASALEVVHRLDPFLAGFRPAPPPPPSLPDIPDPWEGVEKGEPKAKPRGGAWSWLRYVLIAALLLVGVVAAAVMLAPRPEPDPKGGKKDGDKPPEKKDDSPPKDKTTPKDKTAKDKDKPAQKDKTTPKDKTPPKDKPPRKEKTPPKDKGKPPDTSRGESHVFRAHEGPAGLPAVSPDGKLAATYGADKKVALWDLEKRERRWVSGPYTYAVREMAFDRTMLVARADGVTLGLGVADGKAVPPSKTQKLLGPRPGQRLDLNGAILEIGKQAVDLAGGGHGDAVSYHPTSDAVLVRTAKGQVFIVEGAKRFLEVKAANGASCAVWSGSGGGILVGLPDGEVFSLDKPDGMGETFTHPVKGSGVRALCVSPEGKRVMACFEKGELLLFDLSAGAFQLVAKRDEARSVTGAAFALGGKGAVTTHRDGTLRLWDLSKAK